MFRSYLSFASLRTSSPATCPPDAYRLIYAFLTTMKHKKTAAALKKECAAIVDLDALTGDILGGKSLLGLVESART